MEHIKETGQAWLDAFNAHDLEKLLSLYDDSAEHYSPKLLQLHPETNGKIVGKPALRKWWADAFKRLPSLQYEKVSLDADENKAVMVYRRKVEGEEDILVSEILEITSGKIVASSVEHLVAKA